MITITEKEFKELATYIKSRYGINLKEEKKTLVMGRLQNVVQDMGYDNFTDYYNSVVSDKSGDIACNLINKITTNYTFFMREADHFNYLRDKVLPLWINNSAERDLRIWSAGCSSGEEPYTLAMIIDELLGYNKIFWDSKILATDISTNVLETAAAGQYKDNEISTLPLNWRMNYFKSLNNGNSTVIDRIRNEIIYRRFNLMEEKFPFKHKFHVIFCRNVMIYFDINTRNRLIDKFYDSLEHGGYLFIGHSECIDRNQSQFKYIMPAIYRKE